MPPASYPHLELIRLSNSLPRRKRPGISPSFERQPKVHGQSIAREIELIQQEFIEQSKRQPSQFNPALIMRARLAGGVSDATWRAAGLEVLASEPDKATILFASDTHLSEFMQRLNPYRQGAQTKKDNPVNAWISCIDSIEHWGSDDRAGRKLKKLTIIAEEYYVVDVELWYFDEKETCRQRLNELKQFIQDKGQEFLDSFLGNSLCLARVRINGDVLNQLLDINTIATIELPPQPDLSFTELQRISIDEFEPISRPPDDAPRICIIDSGLESGHPILGPAVGDTSAIPVSIGSSLDDAGHGTMVGGIALYGDLIESIKARRFQPEMYLFSVRVTNSANQFDDCALIVNQMKEAIELMHGSYGCRVFNISLGDPGNILRANDRPSFWATILDELARAKDIVIVVSAGNRQADEIASDPEEVVRDYKHFLFDDNARLMDPAMAANVLTVGSLVLSESSYWGAERHPKDPAYQAVAKSDQPSPFTRRGPGVENAIKPELCEYGGNWIWDGWKKSLVTDPGLGIVSASYRMTDSLFRSDNGTSFAAPKVAHFAAKILGQYPQASANLVRALLVASAKIPQATIDLLGFSTPEQKERMAQICGYGKPDLNRALYSSEQRVTLIAEDIIELDHFQIYAVPIPEEFMALQGRRRISVTLAFDPPVRRTRREYTGCRMSFRLIRNLPYDQIVAKCEQKQKSAKKDKSDPLKAIDMWPGFDMRHPGTVQKGIWEFKQRPHVEDKCYLVVWCEGRWAAGIEEMQRYAVVVTYECIDEADINLYNLIRPSVRLPLTNRIRV